MNHSEDFTPIPSEDSAPALPQSPAQDPARGYSIAALALGIASLFCCCCYYIAGVLAILGIVLAFIARKKNGGRLPTLALIGLVLAIIGLVLFLCFVAFEIYLATIPDAGLQDLLDACFEAIGMDPSEIYPESGVSP